MIFRRSIAMHLQAAFKPATLLSVVALLLGGCAGDISPNTDDPNLPGPGGPQAQFSRHAGGYYQATIDSSGNDWVYIDLESQTQVFPANPANSDEWDIAHKGTEIKLNGGVSGTPPSGIAAAAYGSKSPVGTPYPFETLEAAPPESQVDYVTDRRAILGLIGTRYAMTSEPAADMAANPLTGAGDHGWYHSSGINNGAVITARSNVGYILRTPACRYYKLRMTGYDDGSGTGQHPQYDLKEITSPGCSGNGVAPLGRASFETGANGSTLINADASSEDDWVYLDFANARQTVPTAPDNDANGWDIAIKRSDLKLNSGASGIGTIAIHDGLRDDWEARTTVPTAAEWHTDTANALAFLTYPPREIGAECAFNADGDYGWHYYSGFCDKGNGNHHISPRDVVYLVRGRAGAYWKLRIQTYYSDAGAAGHLKLEYAVIAAR